MTACLKYRWVAVSLVWAMVLGITGLNIHRVDRIQTDRRNLETMQMDLRFLKTNQATIKEVRLQKSRLTHLMTSQDMGFLVVENNLKRLSWDFGVQTLSVETDTNESSSQVIPITTVAHGTVPAVAGWIAAVEKAYPYLVIRRMELAYEPKTKTGNLQATFDYHFTLFQHRTGELK